MKLTKAGLCVTSAVCGTICCGDCQHLKNNLCSIYADRPHGCRIYPHNPMALEKGCTIYFKDWDTLGVINADNYLSYPDDVKRQWLEMTVE